MSNKIILKCNRKVDNSSKIYRSTNSTSSRTRLSTQIVATKTMQACITPRRTALQVAVGTEATKTGSRTRRFRGIWRFPTIIRAAAPLAAPLLTSSIPHSSCISLLCRRLTSTLKIRSKKLLLSEKFLQKKMMWLWISLLLSSSHLRINKQSYKNKCSISNLSNNRCHNPISSLSRSRPSRVLHRQSSRCCDLLSAFLPSRKWSKSTLQSYLPAIWGWLNRRLHRFLYRE